MGKLAISPSRMIAEREMFLFFMGRELPLSEIGLRAAKKCTVLGAPKQAPKSTQELRKAHKSIEQKFLTMEILTVVNRRLHSGAQRKAMMSVMAMFQQPSNPDPAGH
jgi:hypothetical protein